MSSSLRRGIRHANIALAIFAPVLVIGTILLKLADVSDGVLQAFGMTTFFSGMAITLALETRYERRHGRRDESGDQ